MQPALHPLNREFTWTSPEGPFRILDPARKRDWDENGFFLLPNAFSAEEIARVVSEIDPIEARVAEVLRAQPGGKVFIAEEGNITFSTHLVSRSAVLRSFCAHPVFSDLCHDVIGRDARLYWDQAVYKKPERPGTFPWHQDNGYTYLVPQQYLTCWVALTNATRDNGCPRVAPGQHRRGTLAHTLTDAGWQCLESDPEDAVAIEARAGDIVVFSSLTPHCTGPNTSDGVRKTYIVQFAPDGAVALADGSNATRQDDPVRQYPVLRDGAAVSPDAD